jgi:hypothetical protein
MSSFGSKAPIRKKRFHWTCGSAAPKRLTIYATHAGGKPREQQSSFRIRTHFFTTLFFHLTMANRSIWGFMKAAQFESAIF